MQQPCLRLHCCSPAGDEELQGRGARAAGVQASGQRWSALPARRLRAAAGRRAVERRLLRLLCVSQQAFRGGRSPFAALKPRADRHALSRTHPPHSDAAPSLVQTWKS